MMKTSAATHPEPSPADVTLLCRIRRPLDSELPSKAKSRPVRGALPDCDYSIFTPTKESDVVLASETLVSGKLISASLTTADDVSAFVRALDQKNISTFRFDRVVGPTVSQEEFYTQHVRGLVQGAFQGHSATAMFYGPTGYVGTRQGRE